LRTAIDRPYSIASVLYIDVGGILVSTLCSENRFPEALEVAERVNQYGVEIGNSILVKSGLALRAEISLRQGLHPEAKRWARSFSEQPLQAKYNAYLPELTLARVLLEADTAASRARMSGLLDRLEEYARKVHYRPVLIQTLALRALLLDRQGDRPTALKILSESVAEAQNGSGVRFFLDLGPRMADLLAELQGQGGETDFVEEILEEFAEQRSEAAPIDGKVQSPAALQNLDKLTHRELDVLELLAQRLQNKEIAARLCISTQTVGSHLKRIYDKLDVHGRRQAVKRAMEEGILDRRPPG
jgi:LuxR family maltose regulon positive regulatory protein